MNEFNYAKELLSVAKIVMAAMREADGPEDTEEQKDDKVVRWENAGPSKRPNDPTEFNEWKGYDMDDNVVSVRYQIIEPGTMEEGEGGKTLSTTDKLLTKVRNQFPGMTVSRPYLDKGSGRREDTKGEIHVIATGEVARDIVSEVYTGPLTEMYKKETDEGKRNKIAEALKIAKAMSDDRTELGDHFNKIAKVALNKWSVDFSRREGVGTQSDFYSRVTEKLLTARDGAIKSLKKGVPMDKFIKDPESVYRFFTKVYQNKGMDALRHGMTDQYEKTRSDTELEGEEGGSTSQITTYADPNYVEKGTELNDEELAKTKQQINEFIEYTYEDDAPRAKAYWEVWTELADKVRKEEEEAGAMLNSQGKPVGYKGVNNSADFTPAINKKLREIGWLGPDDDDLENSSTSHYMGALKKNISRYLSDLVGLERRKNTTYEAPKQKTKNKKDQNDVTELKSKGEAPEEKQASQKRFSSDEKASLKRFARALRLLQDEYIMDSLREAKNLIG